jgi:lysozyme family protein
MTTRQEIKVELERLRARLVEPFQEAKARDDTAEMERLQALAGEIDDALDDLAILQLAMLAKRLEGFREKIEKLKGKALAWPFGDEEAPADHEKPFVDTVPQNDFMDEGPDKPPPVADAVVVSTDIPTVSKGWSEAYGDLWESMEVSADWKSTANAICRKIIASQNRYAIAVSGTGVPWWFIAVIHAMECSLRFDQHLHNGDPISHRTKRVPKDRPPAGSPPFSWEESAKDAVRYQKFDQVKDWSLPSALYHWHRYNGINNEYKRRGIPTPYLWSGCQHYRKGKYVADGVFDENAVSRQAGAAVLLKTLIDLDAVVLKKDQKTESNPAVATGEVATLDIDTSGADFKHVKAELAYPGLLKNGSSTTAKKKTATRHVQEWLNIHDCVTSIDGDFGVSTQTQLRRFQLEAGREPTGELDAETWALLTAPMRSALAMIDHGAAPSLESAVLNVAKQHIAERPVEVGGNNRGPWVRLYMRGREGKDQKWCAGFTCLIVAQAARDLNIDMPFPRQVGVDALVGDAKDTGRYIKESEAGDSTTRKSKIPPGSLFVVRRTSSDWTHVGIVLALKSTTFDTYEGNTGGDGGTDGANARRGNRSYGKKDFLRLV